MTTNDELTVKPETELDLSEDLYVVFDGPPGPEPGRFVELHDWKGRGVGNESGVNWTQDDGYWLLGPFRLRPKITTGCKDMVSLTPEERVEQVAMAILQSDVDHGICGKTWSEENERDKELYRDDARAAINVTERW